MSEKETKKDVNSSENKERTLNKEDTQNKKGAQNKGNAQSGKGASNKGNAQNAEGTKEKVVTKYDLKVQRREAEKAQAKKDKLVGNIMGAVIVAALFCLVVSFPIRNYLAVNETYAKVNGEKISRVEFDYNYNIALNNYLNQYGSYMSMFGMDLSGDLSQQMYSEELTFQDFFTQLAIESISENKALLSEAKAAGFSYDTAADYAEYEQEVKDAAAQVGMSVKDFVRENYGTYATLSRISGYVKESMYLSRYYDSIADSKMPSGEEAESYYNDNKDSLDSVDYRVLTVDALLSEAPTEEETAAAMAEAKKEAEAAEKKVAAEGEPNENVTADSAPYLLESWLFDSARKPGDTTVIENTSGNSYYVVAFENRYRDETPTVKIRAILTAEDNAQEIMDEWKSGEATEDSFAVIADKYNDSSLIAAEGGLLESVRPQMMTGEMGEWLSDGARTTGDTTVIISEDDPYSYVLYYLGEGEPWWSVSAKNALLGTAMEAYMAEITANISVEDPKGNLKYLHISENNGDGEGSSEAGADTDAAGSSEAGTDTDAAGSSEAGADTDAAGSSVPQ